MNKIISACDWSEAEIAIEEFFKDNVEEYFNKYDDLFGRTIKPFNLGAYIQQTSTQKLRTAQYVGVMPLRKLKQEEAIDQEKEPLYISVRSRFSIDPAEMLKTVIEGDDYYDNPSMLNFKRYTLGELSEYKPNQNEKLLFGSVTDAGRIDLNNFYDGNSKDENKGFTSSIANFFGIFEMLEFLAKAKDVCKRSLKRSPEIVEENLNCKVKGRIVVSKQLKNNVARGREQMMFCAYPKLSENTVENRILRYALYLCEKSLMGDSLGDDIAFCKRALAAVPVQKCSLSDFLGLKTNGAYRYYKPALNAAKQIITRYSICYKSGNGDNENAQKVAKAQDYRVVPFFIDMNILFEYYCRAVFRAALKELGSLKLEAPKKFELYDDGNNSEIEKIIMKEFIPDLYITDNEGIRIVLDAKYSLLCEQSSFDRRSRTHQLLFYMTALNCGAGVLLAPKEQKEGFEEVEVKNNPGHYLAYLPLTCGFGNDVENAKTAIKNYRETLMKKQ